MISAILKVKGHVHDVYIIASLDHILGDLYWSSGRLFDASECYEAIESILQKVHPETIANYDSSYTKEHHRLEIVSLFNRGLCSISFWELEKSKNFFEQAMNLAERYNNQRYIVNSSACLGFIYSYLGRGDEAQRLAVEAYSKIFQVQPTSWGRTYSLFFIAKTHTRTGDLETAYKVFSESLQYAQDCGYKLAYARSLTGLAELYGEDGNFDTAISTHSKSIAILEEISAIPDLAEAYYQLGKTYRKMNNYIKANEKLDYSTELFSSINAQKQIFRVKSLIISL
jgi:tetratricopeptide (TPR) repeat protein